MDAERRSALQNDSGKDFVSIPNHRGVGRRPAHLDAAVSECRPTRKFGEAFDAIMRMGRSPAVFRTEPAYLAHRHGAIASAISDQALRHIAGHRDVGSDMQARSRHGILSKGHATNSAGHDRDTGTIMEVCNNISGGYSTVDHKSARRGGKRCAVGGVSSPRPRSVISDETDNAARACRAYIRIPNPIMRL